MKGKILSICLILTGFSGYLSSQTLALHPDNPHYFLFRGEPTILVTSGEHYGAVMNRTFDYIKYLNTLQSEGFNYTRIFCSGHVEMADATFGIERNTMDPLPGNYLTPWKRIRERKDTLIPVYDLEQWDPSYFSRLHSFIEAAGKRGIVVEISLASSCYSPGIWSKNPLNTINNQNLTEILPINRVHTLYNGRLMHYQEQLVQKLVRELNGYDNVFYEIQNEPWADQPCLVEYVPEDKQTRSLEWQKLAETANPVSLEWQAQIVSLIVRTESNLPKKHLIAQNISNFRAHIQNPDRHISIFNFHYALPEAVSWNKGLNKAIGLDETGFMVHNDFFYRRQAWQFLMAGGSLYNNLDYSYTTGQEDGSWTIGKNPGWGGSSLRAQLKIMKDFFESFDFTKMNSSSEIIFQKFPRELGLQVLSEPGRQYAIYVTSCDSGTFTLSIPDGNYKIERLDPISGQFNTSDHFKIRKGQLTISVGKLKEDVAYRIFNETADSNLQEYNTGEMH